MCSKYCDVITQLIISGFVTALNSSSRSARDATWKTIISRAEAEFQLRKLARTGGGGVGEIVHCITLNLIFLPVKRL